MAAGFAAGMLGKKVFDFVWTKLDDEDPPSPDDPEANFRRLMVASVLEGAVFTATRTATDRGARRAYFSLTGSWPGTPEEQEEAEDESAAEDAKSGSKT